MCFGRVTRWMTNIKGEGWFVKTMPTAENMLALELCVSDAYKPLLLASTPPTIPYL